MSHTAQKTHRDLESIGVTAQVIGTAEMGDPECITMKTNTVSVLSFTEQQNCNGIRATCRDPQMGPSPRAT